MRLRVLGPWILAGIGVVAAALTALVAVVGPEAPATTGAKVTLDVVAAAACAVAAGGFGRGDYLRRGWGWLSAGYALLTLSQVARYWRLPAPGISEWVDQIGLAVGNLVCVVGVIHFGLTLRAAGLSMLVPRWRRRLFFVGATALAVHLTGPNILDVVLALGDRGLLATGDLISPSCDFVSFVVIAPLALTALSLRGGELAWVYGLLVVYTFGWMVNDAAGDFARLFAAPGIAEPLYMLGFALGCLGLAGAAICQRVISGCSRAHLLT